MKACVAAGLLAVANALLVQTASYAQEPRVGLSPAQTRFYHQCLTDGWIEEFCRGHGWGFFRTYDQTKAECIAAQHDGRYIVNGRRGFISNEAYCWEKAHTLAPIAIEK